jgi:hypothetical protein
MIKYCKSERMLSTYSTEALGAAMVPMGLGIDSMHGLGTKSGTESSLAHEMLILQAG